MLDALLTQLDTAESLRVPDFVERSQFLIQISTADVSKENGSESIKNDVEGMGKNI